MNNTATGSPMTFQGVSDQLKKAITSLSESSQSLQQAIIHRDTKQVWQLLAEQQEHIERFDHYNLLWKQLVIDTGLDTPQLRTLKEDLESQMKKMRKVNSSNGSLIKSFLSAIDRAFRHTAVAIGGNPHVYGKKGKMNMQQKSLLVDQVG